MNYDSLIKCTRIIVLENPVKAQYQRKNMAAVNTYIL